MSYLASENFDEASRDSVMQNYSNISIIKKLLRQPERSRTQPLSIPTAGPGRSNEILDVTLSDTKFSQKSVTASTEDEFWHALRVSLTHTNYLPCLSTLRTALRAVLHRKLIRP
jgi:hypothetical protein